jgi:hypothetical protein
MITHSVNHLALELEVDRATLVRALRDVEPDAGGETNRPQYKILTAINALALQRAKNPRADGRQRFKINGVSSGNTEENWQDPVLMQLFEQQDQAEASMAEQPTLEGRRKAAIAMVPLLARVYAAIRERGRLNGLDPDATDYRSDHLYLVGLRAFEKPCEWSEAETRSAMSLWKNNNDGS